MRGSRWTGLQDDMDYCAKKYIPFSMTLLRMSLKVLRKGQGLDRGEVCFRFENSMYEANCPEKADYHFHN